MGGRRFLPHPCPLPPGEGVGSALNERVTMVERMDDAEKVGLAALEAVKDTAALEAWRVAHLGRSSALMSALGELGKLPQEERPAMGQRGNEVKRRLEEAHAARAEALRQAELDESVRAGALDVTLPGRPVA